MVRCVERTDEDTFLVALERLDTLSTVLGKVEIVGEIQGYCVLNCPSPLFLLVCVYRI